MNIPIADTHLDENGDGGRRKDITPKNGANFETAIKATGFGKFNYMLICFIFPASFSQIFEQLGMSYVVPIAQCDLNLSLENKGLLNAVTYAGMISSGFLFGYICDSWGRKKVIVYGYLANALFVLIGAFSWSFPVLVAAKFCSGFIYTGPFSAVASSLSEFHSSKYRSRIQIVRGMTGAIAAMSLPLLAWGILPHEIKISFFGLYDLHSWNLFLMACCLAPLTSGLLFTLVPETPKFLMSQGRNDEALQVFRKVYRMNTGREDYPITLLIDEQDSTRIQQSTDAMSRRQSIKSIKSVHMTVKKMMGRMKPLFLMPYNIKLVHVCANSMFLLMGSFALKLWYPQLLTTINDYMSSNNGSSSTMCVMMEGMKPDVSSINKECTVNIDNSSVYTNSIIVGAIQFVTFLSGGVVINKLGKKRLIMILTFIAGSSAVSLYFAQNSTTVVIMMSYILPFSELSGNILITTTLEIFPTNFRTMALSFQLVFARLGLVIGNVIFPYLIQIGCLPLFLSLGTLILSTTILTFLYPNTENKALK